MAKTKITSPIEGFTATTYVGGMQLEFKDGVAEVDGLNDGARNYLLTSGYKVDSDQIEQPTPPAPVDSRQFDTPEQVGTPLRDAAVDPQPGDFLPPTNAGQADPHGPEVVSPEIHASEGVRPVKGGDVHVDDPDAQEKAETAHTVASTDGTPVNDGPEPPAGNASTEAWRTYALTTGATEADVEGKSRDDLRAAYGPKDAG